MLVILGLGGHNGATKSVRKPLFTLKYVEISKQRDRIRLTTVDQHTSIEGLISGSDIQREFRQRRKQFVEKSVPFSEEAAHLRDGWEVLRRNKTNIRLRRPKSLDHLFEDEVWCLLARMGFDAMSSGRNFRIPVSTSTANVPPKQIDVLAIDGDTALVVECKVSKELTKRSLQTALNETRALQNPIRAAIHDLYEDQPRVCFVYATRNIRWSKPDRERAKDHQIKVLHDRDINYFKKLVEIIGPAARHQLEGDLLEGSRVSGLRTNVPALRGRFGGKRFYQFAIEPSRLLKLAYVSHRTKIDSEAVVTYQRLLRKSRLRDISKHINETGGIFPTNVVVNFRDENLRFDPASAIHDDPTVLGTLYLPNKYKSAWVIDGQHRLYGFSLSDRAARSKVPVLAFENLSPVEEASMFVDINNKQVKVTRSLLVALRPDLRVGPGDPQQELETLHSQVAIDLSEDEDSPLSGRVASEWDTDRSNKPLTLPQLVYGIAGSQLLGSFRSGTMHTGFLTAKDWEATRERSSSTISKFLNLFAEGAPDHWNLNPRSGGLLCTNLGITGLLRVFRAILEHKRLSGDLDYREYSPDAVIGIVSDLAEPIVDWFNPPDESKLARFRGRYGGSAPRIYGLTLMQIIHEKNPSFSPPGIQEFMTEGSSETIARAHQLLSDTEDAIRELTLFLLKDLYDDGWWRDGVPGNVRGNAAQRSEQSNEPGEPHQFLGLLDFKRIAAQPKHWRDFEQHWTIDPKLRSKNDKLAWMDRLSDIRNRAFHSGRREVSSDEIVFLETILGHVQGERSRFA